MKTNRIIASDFLTTMMSSALTIYIYWFAYQYFSSQSIISIIGFGQLSGVFLSSLGGGISDSMNKLLFIKVLNFFRITFYGVGIRKGCEHGNFVATFYVCFNSYRGVTVTYVRIIGTIFSQQR
ncbi:hypothetical protein [Staphylococcus delphini]|uniref:hypothetical protein n=1 Tax=Staphylococcus delphini TaxID=53344 RepID=UPI003364DEB6